MTKKPSKPIPDILPTLSPRAQGEPAQPVPFQPGLPYQTMILGPDEPEFFVPPRIDDEPGKSNRTYRRVLDGYYYFSRSDGYNITTLDGYDGYNVSGNSEYYPAQDGYQPIYKIIYEETPIVPPTPDYGDGYMGQIYQDAMALIKEGWLESFEILPRTDGLGHYISILINREQALGIKNTNDGYRLFERGHIKAMTVSALPSWARTPDGYSPAHTFWGHEMPLDGYQL